MKNINTKNPNKTWTIYKHTCKLNGLSYIGQTSAAKVSYRWGRAGKWYQRQRAFWAAIQEFGWDNFDHEILESDILTLSEANKRERYWIAYYHTWIGDQECRGYNATPGGNNRWYIASDETREKMRQAKLGKFHTDEYKRELSKIFGGQEIICIETQQVYLGKNEAERQTGIRHIGECCNHHREIAGGFHWAFISDVEWQTKFEDFKNKERKITKVAKRKIECIETGEVFESIAAAMKTYHGCIAKALSGERETAAGKHWRYMD